MPLKLGCNPVPIEKKNKMLRLGDYVKTPEFLVHPASWDWGKIVVSLSGIGRYGECRRQAKEGTAMESADNARRYITPCKDCIFWQQEAPEKNLDIGLCRRRHAPSPSGTSVSLRASWPSTSKHSFCGDGCDRRDAEGGSE